MKREVFMDPAAPGAPCVSLPGLGVRTLEGLVVLGAELAAEAFHDHLFHGVHGDDDRGLEERSEHGGVGDGHAQLLAGHLVGVDHGHVLPAIFGLEFLGGQGGVDHDLAAFLEAFGHIDDVEQARVEDHDHVGRGNLLPDADLLFVHPDEGHHGRAPAFRAEAGEGLGKVAFVYGRLGHELG